MTTSNGLRDASSAKAGAIDACADANAAVSFSPSPTIRTRLPSASSALIRSSLSVGRAFAVIFSPIRLAKLCACALDVEAAGDDQ
jgi:hypothetical protein